MCLHLVFARFSYARYRGPPCLPKGRVPQETTLYRRTSPLESLGTKIDALVPNQSQSESIVNRASGLNMVPVAFSFVSNAGDILDGKYVQFLVSPITLLDFDKWRVRRSCSRRRVLETSCIPAGVLFSEPVESNLPYICEDVPVAWTRTKIVRLTGIRISGLRCV